MDATAQTARRGSRREDLPPTLEGPAGGPGLAQRALAFESYIGFQHDFIGLLAGLIVALGLLVRWTLRRAPLQARR